MLSYGPNALYQCTLNNSTGAITTCGALTTPSLNPRGISFGAVNGTQYAYVAGINGHMYLCNLAVDGSFSSCAVTPSSGEPSWSPRGVTITTVQ